MIALFATQPAIYSPFRRESRASGRDWGAPIPSVVCPAGQGFTPGHRTAGNGRNAAMASSISRNNPRETITSAIWNVIDRPCRTIFAPIFTNRSRDVVVD